MVVSPTDILIEDQIRILKSKHSFTDVEHLQHTAKGCFIDQKLEHKLVYLTPETFQDRDLLKEFICQPNVEQMETSRLEIVISYSKNERPDLIRMYRPVSVAAHVDVFCPLQGNPFMWF